MTTPDNSIWNKLSLNGPAAPAPAAPPAAPVPFAFKFDAPPVVPATPPAVAASEPVAEPAAERPAKTPKSTKSSKAQVPATAPELLDSKPARIVSAETHVLQIIGRALIAAGNVLVNGQEGQDNG